VSPARWSLWSATLLSVIAHGAETANPGTQPALTPRTAAQFDLTGYWVSVITKDWVYRMVTPEKGDRGSVPLNANGMKAANEWDRAKDTAEGEQCKAYGAAGVMHLPGRLHIDWQDDSTLKIDLDAGMQTRLFHFADFLPPGGFGASETPISLLRFEAPAGTATRQGYSIAAWQKVAQIRGLQIVTLPSTPPPTPSQGGSVMVMTTRMQPGYLQKNGIPYSADAVLTEYFNRIQLPDAEDYLVLTSIVDDPVYLNEPYVTSAEFKREKDGSKWLPSPCNVD
jgi:hypothetical protein